eukprot:463287-Pyramimonas_sp.AAC.1
MLMGSSRGAICALPHLILIILLPRFLPREPRCPQRFAVHLAMTSADSSIRASISEIGPSIRRAIHSFDDPDVENVQSKKSVADNIVNTLLKHKLAEHVRLHPNCVGCDIDN